MRSLSVPLRSNPSVTKSTQKHAAMANTKTEPHFVHLFTFAIFFEQFVGSAVSLSCTSAPLFKQMGIYDEFHALSRALAVVQVVTAPELETAFLVAAGENPTKR